MSHIISDGCTGCTACIRRCPVNAITGHRNTIHIIDPRLCIDCGVCGKVCPVDAVYDRNDQIVRHDKPSHWPKPIFNLSRCSACRICIQICPVGSLSLLDSDEPLAFGYPYLREVKRCIGCAFCAEDCYLDVIKMTFPD